MMNVKCAKIGSALTFFSTMLLLILVPRPGEAATINVANGDVSGLIAAINTANVTSGADTISLAANGTYTLTTVDHRDIYEGFSGLPVVGSPITISGNGAIIETLL